MSAYKCRECGSACELTTYPGWPIVRRMNPVYGKPERGAKYTLCVECERLRDIEQSERAYEVQP